MNDIKLVLWDGVENHLEKLPTHPLSDRAVDIVSTVSDCFVVFANGSIQNISYLTQKKKMPIEENVLPETSEIK